MRKQGNKTRLFAIHLNRLGINNLTRNKHCLKGLSKEQWKSNEQLVPHGLLLGLLLFNNFVNNLEKRVSALSWHLQLILNGGSALSRAKQ